MHHNRLIRQLWSFLGVYVEPGNTAKGTKTFLIQTPVLDRLGNVPPVWQLLRNPLLHFKFQIAYKATWTCYPLK